MHAAVLGAGSIITGSRKYILSTAGLTFVTEPSRNGEGLCTVYILCCCFFFFPHILHTPITFVMQLFFSFFFFGPNDRPWNDGWLTNHFIRAPFFCCFCLIRECNLSGLFVGFHMWYLCSDWTCWPDLSIVWNMRRVLNIYWCMTAAVHPEVIVWSKGC